MSVWKAILFIIGLGLAFIAGAEVLGWYVGWHTGTLKEAAAKVRAHRSDIHRISEIIRRDPTLGWVNPGSEAKDLEENGPLTRQTIAGYSVISALLSRGDFHDLAIVRDKKPPHLPLFARFVVFDPGWFGHYKPILAEWAVPPGKLEHAVGASCIAVDDGWFVCPVDP